MSNAFDCIGWSMSHFAWAGLCASSVRAMVDLHNRWNPPFNLTWQTVERGDIRDPGRQIIRSHIKV